VKWDSLTTATGSINPAVPKDILFIAGTDIKFSGSVGEMVQGVIAAHEQVEISGSGTIQGIIMAEDKFNGINNYPNGDGMVTTSKIEGSPHVTYDCGLQPAEFGGATTVVKWLAQ